MNTLTIKFLLLLFSLSLISFSAHARIYKWTDNTGKVHYGDKGAENGEVINVKPSLKLNTPINTQTTNKLIKMYSTSWCGYCKKVRSHLNAKGIAFEDIDVEHNERGKQEFNALNGQGVPIVFVGEQRMDGYNKDKLDFMLRND